MRRSVEERFWKKVASTPDANGCLIWLGYKMPSGYGTFYIGGGKANPIRTTAHRMAWELENGPIPSGLWVLHSCDNPPCVNHHHLFIGTPQDNTADARAKGRLATGARHGLHKHPEAAARGGRHGSVTRPERLARGSRSGTSKLTDEDVVEIRRSWKALRRNQLALKYGVSEIAIYHILTGKTWAHLPVGDYNAVAAHNLARHRCSNLKLTSDKVRTIRRKFQSGGITKSELARRYGVTVSTISCVLSRKIWRRVL